MAVISRLRARWYLVLVGGATLVHISKHGVHRKHKVYYVGTGQILVDSNPSTLTNLSSSAHGLNGRASLIAEYATDPSVVKRIAAAAKVPQSKLLVQAATAHATASGASAGKSLGTGKGHDSVLLRATQSGQTIEISTQAKKPAAAGRLAHATIIAVRAAITRLHNSQPINRVTTPAATATTATTATTSTTATKSASGKKSNNGSAANRQARAAARAQAAKKQQAAAKARAAHAAETSTIVLRQLGSINTAKVVVTPSTKKAVGYGIVAFLVLLVVILLIDNLLEGARRRRQAVAVPVAATASADSDE
jgi:hypothetical protein